MKQFVMAILGLLLSLPLFAQNYEKQWRVVNRAMEDDQPRTVVMESRRLFQMAEKKKNVPQMIRAYLTYMRYREYVSEDSLEVDFDYLKQWCEHTANPVDRSVLNFMLALNEKHYDTSYAYYCRSLGFEQSDEMQIVEALAAKKTSAYIPLIKQEKDSELFGHDMLSFMRRMVHEHLYGDRSQTLLRIVYQRDEDFYRSRGNRKAAMQVALEGYKYRLSAYSNIDELISRYGEEADLVVHKASEMSVYRHEKESLEKLREVIARYPNHYRINELREMAESCIRPSLRVGSFYRELLPGKVSTWNLSTYNVQQAEIRWFRLPNQSEKYLKTSNSELQRIKSDATLAESRTVSISTEPMAYKDLELEVTAPATPGYYILEIAPTQVGEYPLKKAQPDLQLVSVTNLQTLLVPLNGNQWEVWSLDRKSGHPVSGADVNVYTRPKNEYTFHHSLKTGKDGFGVLDRVPRLPYYLQLTKGEDSNWLSDARTFYEQEDNAIKNELKVHLYTDRSIYRPGQTVQFSVLTYVQKVDETKAQADVDLKVEVRKPRSSQSLTTVALTTDEFGVATGKVELPADAMSGIYSLVIPQMGSCTFRVEEYKRPTFEVTWLPIEGEYALGDTITVTGKAQTYAGVPVANARVNLKKTFREMLWWRMSNQKEIGRETLYTDEAGCFNVQLALVPPSGIDRYSDMGVFEHFVLDASVTSEGGETHESHKMVIVSRHKYHLSLDYKDQVCKEYPSDWTVNLMNASGLEVNQPVKLTIRNQKSQETVWEETVQSGKAISMSLLNTLPSDNYEVTAEYDGQTVKHSFKLFSLTDSKPAEATPLWVFSPQHGMQVGQPLVLQFGTSLSNAFVQLNIFNRKERVHHEEMVLNNELRMADLVCREEWGDAIRVVFTVVQDGEVYEREHSFTLDEPDKRLETEWISFRDYLLPGEKETWTLKITKNGQPVKANLMATMYDASLDALTGHHWSFGLQFPRSYTSFHTYYKRETLSYYIDFPRLDHYRWNEQVFDHWAEDIPFGSRMRYDVMYSRASGGALVESAPMAAMKATIEPTEEIADNNAAAEEDAETAEDVQVEMRTNLEETAFFYPMLRTDQNGMVKVQFTLPESLTRWRMMGLAHSGDMDYAMLNKQVTARKQMMVQPHLPRFMRVGDETVLTATVQNLTDAPLKGYLYLELTDSTLNKTVLKNRLPFSAAANGSQTLSFVYKVQDLGPSVVCKMYATAGKYSDGEQHLLPILSDKVWLTESRAVYLNDGKKKVDLSGMLHGGKWWNPTSSMTVETIHNPLWVALESLNALKEPATQNAVDVASTYYAASLATTLKKNYPLTDELKAFEVNSEAGSKWLKTLEELQGKDGGFSWFKGMNSSVYITRMVVEPFVRLHTLGISYLDGNRYDKIMSRALGFLDAQAIASYNRMKKWEKENKEKAYLGENELHYLYLNTLLPHALSKDGKDAVDFFLEHLEQQASRMTMYDKALACIVLIKQGKKSEAKKHLQSLLEYTVYSDELGRYYDTNRAMYSWRNYRIPVQTLLMEVLYAMQKEELTVDPEKPAMATDQIRRQLCQWLLNQRRTQLWSNSSTIMDALYALLMAPKSELQVTVADKLYTKSEVTAKLSPKMPNEWVVNRDESSDSPMSWVSVSMKTFMPMSEVRQDTAHTGLKISREYYIESKVDDVNRYVPVDVDQLQVGQKIRCRIQLSADRDFDFVEIHSNRASCLEPVYQISGYKWYNGLGAYAEVKDAETRFYVDRLAKGKYELYEDFYVTRQGTYQVGLSTVEGTYCPEFSDHTGALTISVPMTTGK